MLEDLMKMLEGLLAHIIVDLVSQYLLNTNRVQKSIELCNEHLFLLNKAELKNKTELVTSYKRSAYCYMTLGYHSVKDYGNAIKWSQKLLDSSRESGNRVIEGRAMFILIALNIFQRNHNEAKELCAKALGIAKETGEKQLEALCYTEQGYNLKSCGEYVEAKEYFEKGIESAKAVGDWHTEARCYLSLADTCACLCEDVKAEESYENAFAIYWENGDEAGHKFQSLCEYVKEKAKESFKNALVIAGKNGNKELEATCYERLGDTFQSLCEYVKAKESFENALVIAGENGDKELEAICYRKLGDTFQSLCQYVNAKESYENALAIAEKNGYKELEAQCYGELGQTFWSLYEYAKAKQSLEKALVIAKENGNKKLTAMCYGRLGGTFKSLGEYVKAKESFENALEIAEENGYRELETEYYNRLNYRQIGDSEEEPYCNWCISRCTTRKGNIAELKSFLRTSINKSEGIRNSLQDHDQFKVSFFESFVDSYREISQLLCDFGNPNDGLYIEELRRARALADLMSAQYSVAKPMSVDLQKWVGLERILEKESNCACLYISYHKRCIRLWGLTLNNPPIFQHKHVDDYFEGKESVDDVFCSEIYRKVRCLASERCEDRSWFPSNAYPDKVRESSQEESLAASRLTSSSEVDEDEEQPISTLADGYKMIIAPVASLLDKPEIIIVPDRLFFKVPFAALKNESGNFLSENIRIRIVPSLTTLQTIQDSPANYHSQTGALIVGDPDVGEVLYKANLCQVSRLPFAGEEAEMIGKLLDAQPLLGKRATKEAVLNNINSVSLIHFACHGDAERGEIVLAPPTLTDRKPQEDDYLLRMDDISQVQLRAKLVVLSCCHSAEGQINAEGVIGIARAFLGSGARSVLAALWAIDDKATKQLMSRFYEHLVRGESASESLHQAMKWMRANGFPEVERWAPFMLIGDNVTLDVHKLRLVELINLILALHTQVLI